MARNLTFALVLVFLCMVQIANAQDPPLTPVHRCVIGSGGAVGITNSADIEMSGVVGQFAIESHDGTGNTLHQGFWVPDTLSTIGVEDEIISFEENLYNFPNPASSQTTIQYSLPGAAYVTLTVYDMVGQVVDVIVFEELQGEGQHNIMWYVKDSAGQDVTSGSYIYELKVQPVSSFGFKAFARRNVMVVVR